MKQKNRMPAFRERLRQTMGDMSVTEFANFVGLSRQTLGFYVNGDRIPDCETLAQICSKCNVSANWLLGLSDTKSLDTNVAAVMQYTGLTEDNVNFLHNPAEFGHDEPLNLYRKSLFTFVNDLLELCRDSDFHTPFFQIQQLISSFKDDKPARPGDPIWEMMAEGAMRKMGYAMLSVNESISFYASQTARALEQAIEDKYTYSIADTKDTRGSCETIEIDGKPYKIWKE